MFKEHLEVLERVRMAERMNYLRRMPALESASFGRLQPIMAAMQEQRLTRGDCLFAEGAGDAGFCVVHEGELKMMRKVRKLFALVHRFGRLLSPGRVERKSARALDQ